MDIFSLLKILKEEFPTPVSREIVSLRFNSLGGETSSAGARSAYSALTLLWASSGWFLGDRCAVQLDEGEEALEHASGVAVVSFPSDAVGVTVSQFKNDKPDPKVIWF